MKRIFSLFLACIMLVAMLPAVTLQAEAAYENTHINTGDQARDIVAVAQTQVGYQEGDNNDNKYGTAFGHNNVAWCAYFISWCAKEAGISDSIIHRQGIASPFSGYFNVPNTHSSGDYFPKPGDLVFYGPNSNGDHYHVGLVETVNPSTGYITTIEGNTNSNGSSEGYIVYRHTRHYRHSTICCYGTPNYETTVAPEKPTITTTTAYYAENSNITISWNPVPGNTYYWINVYKDGTIVVDQSMGSTTSYTIQSAAKGNYLVYVSANNSAGTSGSSEYMFRVIENAKPGVPAISASSTFCKTGASITVSWKPVEGATSYVYYLAEFPTIYTYETNYMCETTTDTSVTFSNLPNGKYYMLVHAVNALGVWGEQSNGIWLSFYNYDYAPVKSTVYNGHLYVLYDNAMSWDLAQALCEMEGGYLVTITSQKENEVVKSLISAGKADGYWIGARNDNSGDYTLMGEPFRWVTGEKFTYSGWRAGEPNGGGDRASAEHFAEIRKSNGSAWNDVKHTTKNGFVLELDISNLAPASTAYYEHSKYLLFDKNITWTEASAICESLGGHLATVSTTEEDKAISKLLKEGNRDWYYIGASKMSGTWKWVDGSDVPMSGGCANWMDTSGKSQSGPTGWGDYLMKYRETEGWIGIPNFYMPSHNMSQIGFVCEIDDAAFTITYDANGGEGSPDNQSKVRGEALVLSKTAPSRSGYSFLGWATSSNATEAEYQPGDTITVDADLTLYAVWKKASKTLNSIEVIAKPTKTVYKIGESLDTTGLKLKATYSDGSTKTVTSGFSTSGFDSSTAGEKTVTVSYGGKSTAFTVTVEKKAEVDPAAPQIVIESQSVTSGQTITVEITAANMPNVKSLMIENFRYDSDMLEFVSAELNLGNAAITDWDSTDMIATVAFTENTDINGVIMTLTFKIKEDVEGECSITCDAYANQLQSGGNEAQVALVIAPGTITVLSYERGDVNGDGYVNSNDAIYLLRYTLSPNRYPINQSGDMNGDGYVNSNDAIYLLRHTLSPARYPLN